VTKLEGMQMRINVLQKDLDQSERLHAETRSALEAVKSERGLLESQNAVLSRRVLELESIKPLLDGEKLLAAEAECARLRELNSNIIEERRAYERDLAAEQRAHRATQRAARETLQAAFDAMDNDGPFAGVMSDIQSLLCAWGCEPEEPEPSFHGIPAGENDKGYPEGTPEHVKRAAKGGNGG